jgi:hypothetical protein
MLVHHGFELFAGHDRALFLAQRQRFFKEPVRNHIIGTGKTFTAIKKLFQVVDALTCFFHIRCDLGADDSPQDFSEYFAIETISEHGKQAPTGGVGYPNWWGTMPMVVFAFLEEYDFSGKTIVPFCTHEGSGMGRSESDIRKRCSDARVLKGLPIRGGSVQGSENDIANWLRKLGEID